MHYDDMIKLRVTLDMRVRLQRLARERETDMNKLIRGLIARELGSAGVDRAANQREQLLFCAVGIDGLLAAHPDETLRARLIDVWQGRLLEEMRDEA